MTDKVQDFSSKFGGRVLVVEVYVNSDEDAEAIAKRVRRAARGPKLNASIVGVKEFTGAAGEAIWAELQQFAAQSMADPRAKPFTDEDDK